MSVGTEEGFAVRFKALLDRICEAEGLSRTQLAEDLGVSPHAISTSAYRGEIDIDLVVRVATGTFGPGLASPFTTPAGIWMMSHPAPSDPAWLAVTLYSEAYVMDFFAPNGFFRQSNLLAITFQ